MPRVHVPLGNLRAVVILIVGRKVGNKLIVEGEEFHGHQDHIAKPPGNGPQEGAD